MARLDLIKFTELHGKAVNKFGLREVGDDGELLRLYDDVDQINDPQARFKFVRTLGEMLDEDDFWSLVADAEEMLGTPTQ